VKKIQRRGSKREKGKKKKEENRYMRRGLE
jgi:hypothetical protein